MREEIDAIKTLKEELKNKISYLTYEQARLLMYTITNNKDLFVSDIDDIIDSIEWTESRLKNKIGLVNRTINNNKKIN